MLLCVFSWGDMNKSLVNQCSEPIIDLRNGSTHVLPGEPMSLLATYGCMDCSEVGTSPISPPWYERQTLNNESLELPARLLCSSIGWKGTQPLPCLYDLGDFFLFSHGDSFSLSRNKYFNLDKANS